MQDIIPRSKKFRLFYLGIWIIYALFSSLFISQYSSFQWHIAIVDAVISSFLLGFSLLGLWFIIRYTDQAHELSKKLILHSLGGMLIIVFVWLYASVYILSQIFAQDDQYQLYLHETFLLRLYFGLLMGVVVFMTLVLFNLIRATRDAALRETSLREMVQKTELQALKNQLNPHFIYNSLNSVSSLTISEPQKAQSMIIRLSDFLRYALKQDATQLTSLGQELENIKLYLQIEQIRFGEKLQFEFKVANAHLDHKLPVMILQPLFENAIKHGLQKSAEPVKLFFTSEETVNGIQLNLSNGFDPAFSRFRGEGVGLENIRNRLRLIYGNGKLLQVGVQQQNTFLASLNIPQQNTGN
jgi:two-component system, LytTR family, sensor kinase